MRYSSVKVLLTVSPFRSSFLQPPAVHPTNDRFFSPLFSLLSELLFWQFFCFDNHLSCPGVSPSGLLEVAHDTLSPLFSHYCALFALFFSLLLFVFNGLRTLLPKHPEYGYPSPNPSHNSQATMSDHPGYNRGPRRCHGADFAIGFGA